MSLVTAADLFVLTGLAEDDHTAARLERAERLVAEALRRPGLESAAVTETLDLEPDPDRTAAALVSPSRLPVTAVATADVTIRDSATLAVATWSGGTTVDVEYTGGWTAATLPESLRKAIADVCAALAAPRPNTPARAPGVAAVALEGASVTFTGPDAPEAGVVEQVVDPQIIRRYRRSTVGAAA